VYLDTRNCYFWFHYKHKHLIKICILIFFNFTDTLKIEMPAVEISSTRLSAGEVGKKYLTAIDSNTLILSRGIGIGDALMRNTGVFTTSTENFSQDLRISMRGYGMRSAFGIRGIKIVVDGIPESTPDGQGDVDNIESSNITSVNILNGPANGIYSNATGGVIEMNTYTPESRLEVNSTSLVGSFGLMKQSLFVGSKLDNHTISFNFGLLNFIGYRDHSKHINFNGQAKIVSKLSSKISNQFIFNTFNNPKSQDPGGLLLNQVVENPKQARDQNIIFNAGENMSQIKFSNLITILLGGNSEVFGTLFYQKRDFENRLAFLNGGAVNFSRNIQGLQIGYKTRSLLLNDDYLQIGFDHDNQLDQRKRFNNQSGIEGDITLDQNESFIASGAYLSYSAKPGKLSILLNGRYEGIKISLKDKFLNNGDQSGDQLYNPMTGSIRLGYNVLSNLYLSGSILKGFETPTLTEIINNPDGIGFAEIDPAVTTGIELSTQYKLSDHFIKLTLFDYQSSNELIPYQLANQQGRVFYRNGGSSERLGLEVESSTKLTKHIEAILSGTINKFSLNNDQAQDLATIIPGIPQSSFRMAIIIKPRKNANLMLDLINNGSIYADQDNQIKVAPQRALHIHSQKMFLYKNFDISPSIGGRLMISELNYNNILINAVGNRYYEPMSRISWYIKLNIGFRN
jgi:iron complex outermembrane recepter protein